MVYVLTVRAAVGEPLLAFWTLEWFLATVQSPVLRQVVFVFESLLAIRAFVWPQVCNSSLLESFSQEELVSSYEIQIAYLSAHTCVA